MDPHEDRRVGQQGIPQFSRWHPEVVVAVQEVQNGREASQVRAAGKRNEFLCGSSDLELTDTLSRIKLMIKQKEKITSLIWRRQFQSS